MEYPEIYTVKGKKYKLIKVHKNYGLYEDEKGFKECFDAYDLGLIKQRKTSYDIENTIPIIF